MMKFLLRCAVYLLIFVVFVGGIGALGYARSQKEYWFAVRDTSVPALQGVKVPKYDPNKPTVAVLLGSPTTEVFDFMVPYEMFAMTGAYNVFAVAPDKKVTSLTGGLDLVPHYSFKEMDELLGKSPDIIVIPFMPMVDEQKYQPVREWIQKHSKTKLLSICGGAGNLADTGLLKGKSATIHWQVFDQTKKRFPETNWIRDQRYVHDGNIVASAGLTSGIDAVLYFISQNLGEPMAEKIAKEMNYPSYHFVKNPKVDPYYIDRSEAIYIFNQAFQWNVKKTGVLLYNGMDDGALASIFDTYSASGTTKVYTLSDSVQPIVTKHNLNLIARYPISNAPKLDRMIVPGTEAKSLAAQDVKKWSEKGDAVEPEFIHSDSAHRFIFDAPLEDLAKQEDVLTAQYGMKRLEYRPNYLNFEGKPFSLEAFGIPLLLSLLAVLAAFYIDRRLIMKKTTAKSTMDA
jgi:AraC family transcriptional regulator, transcriptional activator FtrA